MRSVTGRGKQEVENEAPQQADQYPPLDVSLDLRARGLDQPAVLDPRRTGRFAGAAGQAQADVLDVGGRDGGPLLGHLHHLVDAAARRIHLQAQLAIGGAGVQAQAAVDAAVQVEEFRRFGAGDLSNVHTDAPC